MRKQVEFMVGQAGRIFFISLAALFASLGPVVANECANPDAIGTSRVLKVRAKEYPLVGARQYRETLRLNKREVVLTFDDGPMPPYTSTILDILAAECVKATFFVLGSNVVEAPDVVRRAADEGHTIGTHAFSHNDLKKLPIAQAKTEIDSGIAAAAEALGSASDLAPFFRAPFLSINTGLERHLSARGLMVWSIDADSEDWKELPEETIVETALSQLEKAGKGILLMHDIQPATARALPALLAELKRRKFRIVHVVPAERPAPLATGATKGKARKAEVSR